jgi:hypothetical protein
VALVDEEDYASLSQVKWYWQPPDKGSCAGHKGYVKRYQWVPAQRKYRSVAMHREILSAPAGVPVDHIAPGDGLDNRRCNLRLASASTNARNAPLRQTNKSGYRGVSWHTRRRKWRAEIRVRGFAHHLGYFSAPEAAAAAYETARERMGLLRATSD